MIAGRVTESLERVEAVSPAMVPRKTGAWVPEQSVMEFKREKPEDGTVKEISAEAAETIRMHPPVPLTPLSRTGADVPVTLRSRRWLCAAERRPPRHNEGIHQARREDGDIGQESVICPCCLPCGTGQYAALG
ncbi:hypothetical protein [Lelliottia sp. WB101]|uniref:hypothetical protein n=1 Tax=Lelliottia sp. WB101 TaxID=2153385 RepID=UPI00131EFE75|nr:hypothetical protein [Lelliottia sp. WB101]